MEKERGCIDLEKASAFVHLIRMSACVQELPCHGDPNFVLFDGSKIIIQGDEFLPPRMIEYASNCLGICYEAVCGSGLRFYDDF